MAEIASTAESVFVDGLRLGYRAAGSGAPLVLVHGWPTSSFAWRHLLPSLASIRRVYALDLPGFGSSDKPLDAPYGFRFFSRHLEAFCDQLDLDRVDLVVHDIGGAAGLLWALRQPGRVRRIAVLNAPLYPFATALDRVSQTLMRTPGIRDWMVRPAGLRFLLRSLVANRASLTPEAIEGYLAPFRDLEDRSLVRATLLGPLKSHHDLDGLAAGIAELDTPIALVYGGRDALCGAHMRRLARELPRAEVTVLPNCGHLVQEECPEGVLEAVLPFLREGASSRR